MIKKFLLLLFIVVIVSGCNNSNNDKNTSDDEKNPQHSEVNNGKIYDVGETIEINNQEKGYSYEVIVNETQVTDKFNNQTVKEYTGIEKLKSGEFAIINITLKNIGNQSVNLKEQINPLFGKEGIEQPVLTNYKEKINKDIKVGESLTIDLLYLWNEYKSDVQYLLTFEQYTENESNILIPKQ